jgi:hypothetical protein
MITSRFIFQESKQTLLFHDNKQIYLSREQADISLSEQANISQRGELAEKRPSSHFSN